MNKGLFLTLVMVAIIVISGFTSGALKINFNSKSKDLSVLREHGVVTTYHERNGEPNLDYYPNDGNLDAEELQSLGRLSQYFVVNIN